MSSVRWCGTADVANPRPRKVGGACRRQVLAGARTQETVGGPNGAQRSELRRTAPPDDKRYHDWQSFPDMSWISVVVHACMTLTNAPGLSDVAEDALHMVVLPHQYATDASARPCRVATRGILQSSDRDESHHKRLCSYVLTCFHQSGRRHGLLCNTLIIKCHLF